MAILLYLDDLPIRLTARGAWLHGDEPLHPRVAELFARSLTVDEAGSYIIQLQARRAPVRVEDAAFFVRRMQILPRHERIEAVELGISDGITERLDPRTLMQSVEHVLYCLIERNRYWAPCRFSAQQYHELALYAEQDAQGFSLPFVSGEARLGPYDPAVRPCAAPATSPPS